MDALMIVLVVTFLAQLGGRSSGFATRLAERTGAIVPVLSGLLVAQAVLAAMAVALGIAIAPELTPELRSLLLALALVLVGVALTTRMPRPGSPFGWPRLRAFGTALFGGGAILVADSGMMLVAAAAARSPLPWAAWPAAILGLLGALLPPLMLGEREWQRLPWRTIRIAIGAVLILAGVIVGLSAKGLI
ncbi:hypothetical protein SOM26_11530 [Sphingomonas sp. CFBP8993]|uniref:hypothetical protein n=1 Tax=Sphingomonas sp. CFBP8993 TaxID=3096526 RepID=UPI002A6A0BE9|nr:hypothetical protein [Sphingomonas sp. CFBP8993]MDY0959315.1 hypothetical protein [Sphingomonas sp. CFBP8993]